MANISDATVDRVLDYIADRNTGVTHESAASDLGLHVTTAAAALRQLTRAGLVGRELDNSTRQAGGRRPWVYFVDSTQNPTEESTVRARPQSSGRGKNKHRPATVRRATRGSVPALVRNTLPRWKPGGRGFTIYQMHKQLGQGSYESVRRAVDELVDEGVIVKTDRCRKGARVYTPADQTAVKVSAPDAPPVPANLLGVKALLEERDALRATAAKTEARLAEVELELDSVRALLA